MQNPQTAVEWSAFLQSDDAKKRHGLVIDSLHRNAVNPYVHLRNLLQSPNNKLKRLTLKSRSMCPEAVECVLDALVHPNCHLHKLSITTECVFGMGTRRIAHKLDELHLGVKVRLTTEGKESVRLPAAESCFVDMHCLKTPNTFVRFDAQDVVVISGVCGDAWSFPFRSIDYSRTRVVCLSIQSELFDWHVNALSRMTWSLSVDGIFGYNSGPTQLDVSPFCFVGVMKDEQCQREINLATRERVAFFSEMFGTALPTDLVSVVVSFCYPPEALAISKRKLTDTKEDMSHKRHRTVYSVKDQ